MLKIAYTLDYNLAYLSDDVAFTKHENLHIL